MCAPAHINVAHTNTEVFCPWCHQKSKWLSCNLWAVVLLKFFQGTSFHFMDNSESPFRGNDVLPGIFPLERWSEFTVRADKSNVSQQLRTTNKNAELIRKVSESDAAENVSLPGDSTNSLSPEAQSRDPPARDTLQTGFTSTGSPELWAWVFQSGSTGTLGTCGHAFDLHRASFQEWKTLGP